MKKGDRSVYRIAKIMDVSPRWFREIYRIDQETGRHLFPKKPSKKPRPVSVEDRNLIY